MIHRLLLLSLFLFSRALVADGILPERGESKPSPFHPLIAPLLEPAGGKAPAGPSVNWNGLAQQSTFFLGIQHAFRLATEYDTRNAGGPFFRGYARSVMNLHGWSDGDPMYVNYVGHPMQGAVTGFIWIHNDLKYGSSEFGKDPRYWKSRLRAAAFAWAYSTQFELGPLSEASIGYIQSRYPQQGLVDHVVTPSFGLAWMIAEDLADKYLLRPLERNVENTAVRIVTRSFLNPSRSLANILRGKAPFYREDRGVFGFTPRPPKAPQASEPVLDIPDDGAAPFELSVLMNRNLWAGSETGVSCETGGGAEAAFRMSRQWQWVFELSGCGLDGLAPKKTGDALWYMTGTRWTPSGRRLRPYVQMLIGGVKVTTDEVSPETKKALETAAQEKGLAPPLREEYTTTASSHGFAFSAATGVNLKLGRAAAFRLASLEYSRLWAGPVSGVDFNKGLELKLGVTLRTGTW